MIHDFFFVRKGATSFQVFFNDILYLEAENKHVKIITAQETYKILGMLTAIQSTLPGRNFLRIHRSFIVSLRHLKRFDFDKVFIGANELPIGKQYRGLLQKRVVLFSGNENYGNGLTAYDIAKLFHMAGLN